jgi:hypothetical protein
MQKMNLDATLIPLGERAHIFHLAEIAWSTEEVNDALHAARVWHVEHPDDPVIPCVIRMLLHHRQRHIAEEICLPHSPVLAHA